MTDEINEIIRVLQLTTYDEDEWDADQLTAMKRAFNALDSKMQAAIDWLEVIRRLSLDPPSLVSSDVSRNLFPCRIRRPCVVELAKNPSGRSLN